MIMPRLYSFLITSDITPKLMRPISGCYGLLSASISIHVAKRARTWLAYNPVMVVPGVITIGFSASSSDESCAGWKWEDLPRFVDIYSKISVGDIVAK